MGSGDRHEAEFTVYRLTAPFDGTIIDRHITIGETVDSGSPVFTVADLSTVWIDLSVYQRDIGAVRAGQTARVVTDHGEEAELEIGFVQPLVGEETRTATARIVAPNTDAHVAPRMFRDRCGHDLSGERRGSWCRPLRSFGWRTAMTWSSSRPTRASNLGRSRSVAGQTTASRWCRDSSPASAMWPRAASASRPSSARMPSATATDTEVRRCWTV